MVPPQRPQIVRFGVFEFDLTTGELRKAGARIRLKGQPAAILSCLVRRPGHLVTRDELRRELWGAETFVDFDQSINAAVKRLRAALGDDADVPRFVETLSGQGYRFIGPVETATAAPELLPAAPPSFAPPPPALPLAVAHRLRPVAALSILLLMLTGAVLCLAADRWRGSSRAEAITSLAVLPLANLSPDAELGYFADGMTESVIAELGRVHALRVTSRTSVMRYKGTTESVPSIARTLGVDAIVEGSIVRSEDRVRITVQLIDGRTDVHLWAQSYERPRGDVLVLQREVTRAIVDAIGVTLTGPEAERLARTDTVDPRAHEAYLQGRFFWNQRTESSLRQAIAWFERSIELDRRYAPPHAGLADAYGLLPRYSTDHPRQALLQSKQHALAALERDPRLSEARTALAKMQYTLDYDWAAADESFRRAIDLDPGYATASHWYSVLLLTLGRVEEAVAHARRAAELDPLSVVIKGHLAWVLYLANDNVGAATMLAETLAMNPEHAPSYSLTGFIALRESRHEDAVVAFTRAAELYKNDPRARSHLACGLVIAGRRREAERILDSLHEQAKTQLVPLEAFVLTYAVLGRHDEAFAWLGRSFDDRSVSFYLFDLRLEPLYVGLRNDSRLSDLFRGIGLDLQPASTGS